MNEIDYPKLIKVLEHPDLASSPRPEAVMCLVMETTPEALADALRTAAYLCGQVWATAKTLGLSDVERRARATHDRAAAMEARVLQMTKAA
jgi:hypothetical protein